MTYLTKGEAVFGNGGSGIVPKTGKYYLNNSHVLNTEQTHDLGLTTGPRVSVSQAAAKERMAAKRNGDVIASHADGTDTKASGVDIKGNKLGGKEILEEAKKFIPEAASGGLIGGILSLVLGLAGGPLVGAAVGAGGSILANSDMLKEKLFGKMGKDNKREGGIVSKSIMDKVNKYFPDMTKYGLAGLIPGLLTPLGPIGGIMAGAAFGYLKNNEKFTNKYFGEEGALHIGTKEKKILEKMVPGAFKGAGVGALAGLFLPSPFGLLGNAAIGAGLGMMSTSEGFKEMILGTEIDGEHYGGLVGTLKTAFSPLKDSMLDLGKRLVKVFDDNIVDPIARFVKPAIHELPHIFTFIPRKIGEWFKNSAFGKGVEGFIQDHLVTFTDGMKKIFNPVVGGIAKVITSPMKLLGWAGDKIRTKQIKDGRADYMTAKERIKFMRDKGKGADISELDYTLSSIGAEGGMSVDKADNVAKSINAIFDTKDDLAKSRKDQEKKINSILNNYRTEDGKMLSKEAKEEMRKALSSGDMDGVRKVLSNNALHGSDRGLSQEQINAFLNKSDDKNGKFGDLAVRYMKTIDRENTIKDLTDEQKKQMLADSKDDLIKLGIDPNKLDDANYMRKIAANINTEVLDRKANNSAKGEKSLDEKNNELFNKVGDNVTIIKDAIVAMLTGDNDTLKKKYGINVVGREAERKAAVDNMNAEFDARREAAIRRFGLDPENLTDEAIAEAGFGSRKDFDETLSNLTVKTREHTTVKSVAEGLAKAGIDVTGGVVKGAVDATGGVVKGVVDATGGVVKGTVDLVTGEAEAIGDLAQGHGKLGAKEAVTAPVTATGDVIKGAGKAAADVVSGAGRAVYDVFSGTWKAAHDIKEGIYSSKTSDGLSDNEVLIIKHKMSNQQVAACKGNVKRLAKIMEMGYNVEPKAIHYLYKLDESRLGTLISYLRNTNVKTILGKEGKLLSEEDLEGFTKYNTSKIDNNCKHLKRRYGINIADLNSIEEVMSYEDNLRKKKAEEDVNEATGAEQEAATTVEPTPTAGHSWGTVLSSVFNVGKSILGGIGKGAKTVGKGIGSLFKNKGSEEAAASSGLFGGALSGMMSNLNPFKNMGGGSSGNLDETDKKGDGVDHHVMPDGTVIDLIRTPDGDVQPNTADASTKNALNKLSLKEKMAEKLQAAQLKASELIKQNFDTSNIKGSKGGKIGMLGLLAGGYLLAKSGILKKLYEGLIKPIWTDNVKPWITETALPWINNTLLPKLGKFIVDAIKAINWSSLLGGIADGLTGGNKNNAGKTTTVDPSKLAEVNGTNFETGMVDENGNVITAGDLASGKYTEVYNSEGQQGIVNEDGTISFIDPDNRGSSANQTITKATVRSFIKGAAGHPSKLVNLASKGVSAISKHGGIVGKVVGGIGKGITNVVGFGNKLGLKARKSIEMPKVASKIMDLKAANPNLTSADAYKQLLANGDDNAKMVNKITNAAGDAAKKQKGFLGKLVAKLQKGINKLFSNNKVVKKLSELAVKLGKTNVGKWITAFKESIEKIFKEALEKSVKKVSIQITKNVVAKIPVIDLVMLATDFLVGCDQAESILGVTETTIIEEVVAGLINALCNYLIIPSIFPGVPAIARLIFKWLGTDFEERVSQADEEYQKYVEETGSTLTKDEWLKREKSATGKIGGWISDWWKKVTGKNNKNTEKDTVTQNDNTVASNAIGTINIAKDFSNKSSVASNAAGTLSLSADTDPNSAIFMAANNSYETMISAVKNIKEDSRSDDILNKAMDGKISILSKDFWKLSNGEESDNSLGGTLNKSYSMMRKLMSFPILLVKKTLGELGESISVIGKEITGEIDTSTDISTTNNKKTFFSKLKNIFSKIGKGVKSIFGKGTGNYRYGTGKYSKQIDPSIANIRFNSGSDSSYQTIGDSACGPAAAVNALEAMYGMGGNAIKSAANFALKRGYKEVDGGTEPGFFDDYFNANGYGSQTTYNKSQIERNIRNGIPTVIMGRDPNGVSSSSPFGTNPHYVTVTGTDGRGNAIVQDPESRYDNQLYPIGSLMNKTSLGSSVYGRSAWGMAASKRGTITTSTAYEDGAWWYFKNKMGLSDAGIAGLMGNLYHESGINPINVENTVNTKKNITDEQYTADVDSGVIDRTAFLHPLGGSSKYGYGLAQWTYINNENKGRKADFYDYMKKTKNVSIGDFTSQLEFIHKELEDESYLNTLKGNDLKAASDAIVINYEGPASVSGRRATKESKEKTLNERFATSQSYYDYFKGKSGTEFTGSVTSGTEESTPTNIFELISSKFDTLLNDTGISSFTDSISKISDLYKYIPGYSEFSDNTEPTDAEESDSNINANHSNYANKMVEIAKGELNLGIKETPLGSDKVKYNDWYDGKNEAWCAKFVSWVANQAGVPTTVIPKFKWTPSGYDFFKGREVDKTKAKAGDILFTYSPSAGRISHTGIVTGMTGNAVDSIEGNWSNKVSAVRRGPTKAECKNVGADEYNNLYIFRPNYGAGTGNKPLSKYGQFKNSIYGRGKSSIKNSNIQYNNTGYKLLNHSVNRKTTSSNSGMGTPIFGMGNSIDYTNLINSIIAILMTIADNTDKLNTIVSILNEKLNLNISASDVSKSSNTSLKSKLANALNGINSAEYGSNNSISSIITAMNAIESE